MSLERVDKIRHPDTVEKYYKGQKCKCDYQIFSKLLSICENIDGTDRGDELYSAQCQKLEDFISDYEMDFLSISPYVTYVDIWENLYTLIERVLKKERDFEDSFSSIMSAIESKREIMSFCDMTQKGIQNAIIAVENTDYSFVFGDEWDLETYKKYRQSQKFTENGVDLRYLLATLKNFRGSIGILNSRVLEHYLKIPVYASDGKGLWEELYDALRVIDEKQLDEENLLLYNSLIKVFRKNMVFENSPAYIREEKQEQSSEFVCGSDWDRKKARTYVHSTEGENDFQELFSFLDLVRESSDKTLLTILSDTAKRDFFRNMPVYATESLQLWGSLNGYLHFRMEKMKNPKEEKVFDFWLRLSQKNMEFHMSNNYIRIL